MKNKENTKNEENLKKLMDSFWNENGMNFTQYFEKHREENLLNREDYYELEKEYEDIANKYPNARSFLENENTCEFTLEEQKAILELIDLKEQIKVIELKEGYKLGFKEAYIFFEEMGMLYI